MAGDYRPAFLAWGILFPILATGAVVLRVEARRIKKQRLGCDDWFIIAALVCLPSLTVL